MKCPAGWEKRLLITLIITILTPFLFFMSQIPALAFGPIIGDVTTKAFSVVWTTVAPYTSCGIKLYTDNSYNTERSDISPSQIIIETNPNLPGEYPGEDGVKYQIAKVTVVGLDVGETYYFKPTQNGTALSGMEVTTEKLRGFDYNDPDESDIVSNPIVHKAVYQENGIIPAIGALVLAEIYAHDANLDTDPPLSDYPISAWVGDGMIGDESAQEYNPNDISYKQYAALNMNNLFSKTDNYPLSLEGDNPDTSANESEIIKFTIVHGTQSVQGGTAAGIFTSQGLIEHVDKSGDEKITTSKVSASFKFQLGGNSFAFPFTAAPGYTTGDLLEAIEEAEGEVGIVKRIFSYSGNWLKTYKKIVELPGGVILTQIIGSRPLTTGTGCYIIMNKSMTKEVIFYGTSDSASISLKANASNLISIPQLPAYYETKDLLLDIEGSGGAGENSVKRIFTYKKGWLKTYKKVVTLPGGIVLTQILGSVSMSNSSFAFVILNEDANDVENWIPFIE